ncbi:MAG: sulfotransferase domain-containing protein [Acidobacteria bacterium]|nr:sulfotransferase domain-containing protein [Acidobacteriota bacterium]
MNRTIGRLEFLWRRLTAPWRALPDTLIIGTRRGGTSTLHRHLRRHPDVVTGRRKEIHFFDLNYGHGLNWYRAFFPTGRSVRRRRETAGTVRICEATPFYLAHPLVPERVRACLPGARLIALLRHPVDRASSHYQQMVRDGRETLDFAAALAREGERLGPGAGAAVTAAAYHRDAFVNFGYRSRGLYAEQLRRWLEHFPRGQLLILSSEKFFSDLPGSWAQILDFLELPFHPLTRPDRWKKRPYPALPADLRQRLVDEFRPHNEALFELLGERFDWDD